MAGVVEVEHGRPPRTRLIAPARGVGPHCALVMRSFGAEQLRLPWHAGVTVLPYGMQLLKSAVLPHSAVGHFIEVPPAAP
jgi:hypothetical protein